MMGTVESTRITTIFCFGLVTSFGSQLSVHARTIRLKSQWCFDMHFDLHAVRKVASNGCFSDLLLPAKAKEKPSKPCGSKGSHGASSGIRTPDTLLKRQVLCQLS